MLVITRQRGESFMLPEHDVTITILELRNGRARVGITAPRTTTVLREELQSRTSSKESDVKDDAASPR